MLLTFVFICLFIDADCIEVTTPTENELVILRKDASGQAQVTLTADLATKAFRITKGEQIIMAQD